MTQLQVIPIFLPSGGGGPATIEEIHTFTGIFIFMNIWWAFSWVITGIKYIKYLNNPPKSRYSGYVKSFNCRDDDMGIFFIADVIMCAIWLCVIVVFVGKFIGGML